MGITILKIKSIIELVKIDIGLKFNYLILFNN